MSLARRLWVAAVATAVAASALAADDWVNLATVSMTDAVTPKLTNRGLCYTDGRDIVCDNTSSFVQTGGLINAGALQVSGYVSAGTINTTGTVKVSNTVYATSFAGDGSQLTGVTAASSDRIVSGTTQMVAVSATGYISVTTNGVTTGYFTPGGVLVANGVSVATNQMSATTGYFSGKIGIGTTNPAKALTVSTTSGAVGLEHTDGVVQLQTWVGDDGGPSGEVGTKSPHPLRFYTHDQTRISIDASGRIGIGNFNPVANLDVSGTISASDAIQVGQSGLACGSTISGSIRYNTTSDTLQICTGSGWKSLISTTTGIGNDNLGNHTATQALNMAGFAIQNAGTITATLVSTSSGGTVSGTYVNARYLSATDATFPNATVTALSAGTIAANSLSSTLVSASNISATLVDATRNGTVSGTYGYFRYLSATSISGDGSGLTNISATVDRIISGSSRVVVNSATSTISFTTAGTVTGYLDSTGRAVLPGISVTANQLSATTGYFSGKVGIGGAPATERLEIGANSAASETVIIKSQNYAALQLNGDSAHTGGEPGGAYLMFSTDGQGRNGYIGLIQNAGFGTYGEAYRGTLANALLIDNDSSQLRFGSSGVVGMTLAANGWLGIGATFPSATLHVSGTISATDAIQVGQSTLSCSNGISGSIRFNATSNTIQVCTNSGWKSLASSTTAGADNSATTPQPRR